MSSATPTVRRAILLRPKTAANDGRCLACRNADGALPIRPVDRCCLPTGPVPRFARLRRIGLGGIVGRVFPTLLERGLGLLRGFGDFLRGIFKQRGWYEDRRSLQIAASIAVAVVVMALVVWGLLWTWHRIKRYRLAVGLAGLTVGFGIIRFISLHEVDAWNVNAPWARTAVDLVAAAGVSALAIARLRHLGSGRRDQDRLARVRPRGS
jgi:hypothetical protein